ncbi:MAG: hypothetical protein DWQ31_19585 [Planctomycetota bacterium]|nr:MAG: hypothetical protein DWQ31_19585 [Planctomycetota bacterium]REJ88742.1 MAG: hypothetical protein DWQ35_19255 [Planctomycetota bacterium]REK26583.1 MAG: hypothetical protein DWQ42_08650 [Planctomycetota bacterium]REK46084.1 MAG: hypothetical protein DWQ46_07175 [Planctomycetota bacterium]
MLRNVPLEPKNSDGVLRVILIGRVSKPKESDEQTQLTIESSFEAIKDFLADVYKGPMDIRRFGEQISGMVVDRETILEVWELIESGEWDLVIAEDLSRVYRNPRHQMAFVQDCVDAEMRCICIADSLDTCNEDWEIMLGVATLRHGMHVPDTKRRVSRTATYAFHNGGMVLQVKAGYRKLTKGEAESGEFGPVGLREAKVPEFTPIFHEIRTRLIETRCASDVIDWLNESGVPTGPYVRGDWKPGIFKSCVCDPKLHGWRLFRRTIYKQIFKTGRYKRKLNLEPEREFVPELAHMTLEQQESMLAAVGWRIDWNNSIPSKKSGRIGVSRKQSIWPGQAATCAACGGPMLIYGDFLKCKNSQKKNGRTCWNLVQVDLQWTRDMTRQWLITQLDVLPRVRKTMVDLAWAEIQERQADTTKLLGLTESELQDLEDRQKNVSVALAKGGQLEGLLNELKAIESQLCRCRKRRTDLMSEESHAFYKCREEIDNSLPEVLELLINTSFEFADVMRTFFPRFVVQPIQTLDSGQVYPCGKLHFHADENGDDIGELTEVVLDLFKVPDPIRLMKKIVAERARVPKRTLRQIADDLQTNYMTVKRGLAYRALMDDLKVEEPFRELHQAPEYAPRWGRRNKM